MNGSISASKLSNFNTNKSPLKDSRALLYPSPFLKYQFVAGGTKSWETFQEHLTIAILQGPVNLTLILEGNYLFNYYLFLTLEIYIYIYIYIYIEINMYILL